MKRSLIPILAFTIVMFSVNLAMSLTAIEIVKKGDDVFNAPRDAHIISTMIIIDKNGNKSVRKSEMYQKGTEKRLVRFLYPPDQKGIAFLSLPNDVMYIYLPAFHKIRQIASHVKNQNFAGTDFTYDDLSAFRMAKGHTATLIGEDSTYYIIKLVPKKTTGKEYSFLKVWYRKDNFYPVKVEYYDKNGELFKILVRYNLKKIHGYWIPMEMEVKNIKKNHITKSKVEKVQFDLGLSDRIFTKRYMIRSR